MRKCSEGEFLLSCAWRQKDAWMRGCCLQFLPGPVLRLQGRSGLRMADSRARPSRGQWAQRRELDGAFSIPLLVALLL